MKSLKFPHFVILVAFIVLSCKKEKTHLPTKEEPVLPGPVETIPVEKGLYIPIKIEGSDLSLSFKYKEHTPLLTEISGTDKSKVVISYTAQQNPQKLEKYKENKLIYVVYYEQPDKKTTHKAMTFEHKEKPSTFSPIGAYQLTYNEQNKISTVNYFNNSNVLIKTDNLLYTASLNLSTLNTVNPANLITYTYDQKNGISSHIPYMELLTLEIEHAFLCCSNNNIITSQNKQHPEKNIEVDYEYNENDYPSSMTIANNQLKKTFKIIYKRQEP